MDFGVFLPIGRQGWLPSTTPPQCLRSFGLNRDMTLMAEKQGLEAALPMTKLRGFGRSSEFRDHKL